MVNIKQHKHSGVAMEIPSESMAVESREGSSHLGSALSGEASSETMVTVKEEPLSDCYQYNEYISRDADPGESQYPNVSHVIKQECLPEHQGAKDKSAISEGRNFHNDSAVVKHECMENYQMVADKSSLCEVIKTETVWGDGDSVFHVVNEQECEEYDDCSGSDSDTEAVQYHQDCQTVKRYVFPKHQLVQNQSALSDNCGNGKIIAAATKLPINTEEKPFTCDVCGKQLKYAFLLKRHVKIHTDEKPFKCEFCNKEFRQLCRLRRHMKIHSGEKPFKCVLCKKEFGEAAKLNRHIKTHTGEKPFKCDLCNKEFGEAGKLRRHMRTHTGEKPFTCDLCDRKFQQSNSLRSHMRTHTGETPFRCNLCDKQFRYSGTVIKHMRTHTGEKPFKCHVCGRQFAESCNLTKHVRAKHPQNGNQVIKI